MTKPPPRTRASRNHPARAGRPRRHRHRGAGVLRLAAVAGAVIAATALGFAAVLGTAALSDQPMVFLTAGAVVTAVAAAAGLRITLRSLPPRRRTPAVAALTAALLVLGTAALLVPLADPQRAPTPVAGQGYWQLETGSRLAYLHLDAAGPARATPVLVLHGGPGIPDMAGDAAVFGELTTLGFDVYLYDQLGAGNSTRLADPAGYGIDRDVADLEDIRDIIGADRMVLIGHSYGGTLAAHYLAAHPDHVERMILTSPGPLDPTDTSPSRAQSRLDTRRTLRTYAAVLAPRSTLGYALLQINPAAAHAYLPDAEADARNDTVLTLAEPALHCADTAQRQEAVHGSGFYALQYPQSAGAAAAPDVRAGLRGLPTPTLIIKGSCDYLSWQSAIDYRILPNTTLLYLPGAGHNIYQDQPDDVLAATTAFLTAAPPPTPPYLDDTAPPDYQGPP